MNFYGIRELSNNTKAVMTNLAANKKAVITDNGKPSALMIGINEAVLAFVQKLEMQLAVSELQKQSLKNFPVLLTDEEIQNEINAVRQGE